MNVLVVEAHPAAAESMIRDLRRHRYQTRNVGTGEQALKLHTNADLVLLNLDLPDVDGLEVCKAIRRVSRTPIISFVNAGRNSEVDRVLALQAGADDCVLESCGFREIHARIDAVMRRAQPSPAAPDVITRDALRVDTKAREVRLAGRRIELTVKEFELLQLLAANPHSVVSRKELIARIWTDAVTGSSRTIDTHVSSLRGKLGASSWILTVRGVGYRIGHG